MRAASARTSEPYSELHREDAVTPNGDKYEWDDVAREEAAGDTGPSAEVRIRDALSEVDGLDSRPLSEHAPVYDALHEELQVVLAEIDGA